MLLEYEIAIKLALCMFVGGIIGLEREVSGHPAGLRTMILVSCGSSTFAMIGYYGMDDPNSTSRIIQGIATGLGFLGAGAIIKEGLNVRGLTTAASVWTTAAIGTSIGIGLYKIAALTFIITIVALSLFGLIERVMDLKPNNGMIILHLDKDPQIKYRIRSHIRSNGVILNGMEDRKMAKGYELVYNVMIPRYVRKDRFLDSLEGMSGVKMVQWVDHDFHNGSHRNDQR